MTSCRRCSTLLYFEKNARGKYVPMEHKSHQPHNCPNNPYVYRPKPIYCRHCNKRIMFKQDAKTPNDKWIPLDYNEEEAANEYTGKYTPH